MIGFWTIGIVSAIGIGAVIALMTTWIVGGRMTLAAGLSLVTTLCFTYHALAAFAMESSIFHFLVATIIVPFGYGFGSGNQAFVLALLAQATLASLVGTGLYFTIARRWQREPRPGANR